MDPKILKQSLKEAKESIKNKKYADALKLCKGILREDRANYMALVLLGAALQETEQRSQAPNAYRKATEANPSQPLAWQGLAAFYEKEDSDEGRTELLAAYQKLMTLETDNNRVIEVTNKLAALAQRMGHVDACTEALMHQQTALTEDPERLADNWSRIASVLSNATNLSDTQSSHLEEALSHIINSSTSVDNMENLRRYLRILLRHGKLTLLAEWFVKCRALFPRAEFPLELVCRAYSEMAYGDSTPQLDALMPQAVDDLLAINQTSGIALLAQANFFYKCGKIVEARDVLIQASHVLPQSALVWDWLSRCHLRLYNCEDAETCAGLGVKVISSTNQKLVVVLNKSINQTLLIAQAKSESPDKIQLAVSKCKQLLGENKEDVTVLECLASAYITLGLVDDAHNTIKSLQGIPECKQLASALTCCLLLKQGNVQEAEKILSSELSNSSENHVAIAWYRLGEAQWSKGQYAQALSSYLKAAKVDPMFCSPFTRLADYYKQQANDLDKARRCYQKAFGLNPRCEAAGTGLSDIYRAQNNVEANLELLMRAASHAGAKWAWLRLGLLHLQTGNTEEAINQLLAALRTEPNNSLCWESLGDAYMVRGAYTAAIKSFQRVLELDPQALYATLQVASIKLLLGQLAEAEESFISILKDSPDYIPALKGLGETCLSQARDFLARQLNGRARDKSEEALAIFTKAAKIQGSLACVWKLMGDCCMIPSHLASNTHLSVCSSLLGGNKSNSTDTVKIELGQVLQLATRCYCRALNLSPENSLVWHDLAMSYLAQATNCSTEERQGLLNKALSAAHKATQLTPTNTNHWNLLGVIASSPGLKDFVLAQHAFIQAVQVTAGNVEAWSNLGTLYLSLGDAELAHKAFATAQRTEPAYVQCWVGQALIAEGMGHADAMDLFRHSTQLATHSEAGLGYAHWVCKTFKQQQQAQAFKQAIAAASDELVWYTGHVLTNACAYNLLGLLLERQGLLRNASTALEKALGVAVSPTHTDMVRTNLARVLSALGRHLDAIQHLKALTEPSFHSQCILAQAYFKAEQFQESYTTYESAWHWLAQDDAQKSHILVAMAAMAYKFQGPDGAKTLLFKCAQLKPPSVHGLFASCALGMLHSDLQLSKLVLKELQPYRDDPQYMTDVALFQAYTHFLQSEWSESIRGLSKMIHQHPEHAPLWLSLALLLLNMHPHAPVKASAPCAGAALVLGRASMDISKVQALVSLSHLQAGHGRASLLEAQRAVHLFPDRPESWAVLVAAVLPRCNTKHEAFWLRGTVGLVRRQQDCSSRVLTQWLSNHERKAALLCDQL